MILYNVTLILDSDIEADWLNWMHTEHIAEVMATGCFSANRMLKVLDSPNEGVTYCMQYIADTLEQYHRYQAEFAPILQAKGLAQFENKFVAYRSLMESINGI
ncbi:MAG: DUF4286 family protein [Sphingobacteriaceae bacterium]